MLEIERVARLKHRYLVRDDAGHSGTWERHGLREQMSGDLGGEPYELVRDGRRHFRLEQSEAELARADAARLGRWTISTADATYELGRRKRWGSEMELRRVGQPVGTVRRAHHRTVVCDLPADLAPPAQAFIGFLVLTLWDREADSSAAGAAGAVAASGI